MKITNHKPFFAVLLLLIVGIFSAQIVSAHSSVVVILLYGDDPTPLKNIITVSEEDGDFTDPIAALASIPILGPDAPSVDNPYLIVIGPGIYSLESILFMRLFVGITSSGVTKTILRGSSSEPRIAPTGSLVVASAQPSPNSMSHLSIENTTEKASGASISIYAVFARLSLKNIRVKVDANSDSAIGIYSSFAGGDLNHVEIDITNLGQTTIAMSNGSSPLFINHLEINAFGQGSSVAGMENNFSAVRLRDARISAFGGSPNTDATGVLYFDDGDEFINEFFDGKIIVSGGSAGDSFGIFTSGAAPLVSHVDIEIFESEDSTAVYTLGTATSKVSHCNIRVAGTQYATGASVAGATASSLIEHCTVTVIRPSGAVDSVLAGAVAGTSGHLIVANTLFRGGGVSGDGDKDGVYTAVDSDLGGFAELTANCVDP
ncbi:MAG: hypothetical protein ACI9SX_000517 [Pseudoalteromonas tetraodonis]|jgi:hypothetical protein